MDAPFQTIYDAAFYRRRSTRAYTSASKILRLLWAVYQPCTMVDVGCGTGGWLKAASELGVSEYVGLEGPWLTRELAEVPFERIRLQDLRGPVLLDRQFDLALSLEVAEHLPGECARQFIASLSRLAPVVLFSAAGVQQGGSQHVNEQWPEYWAGLFAEHGFTAVDGLRRSVWNDPEVAWWYAQNAIVYVERGFLATHEALQAWKRTSATPGDEMPLALVHPARLLAEASVKDLLSQIPRAVSRGLQRRFRRQSPS